VPTLVKEPVAEMGMTPLLKSTPPALEVQLGMLTKGLLAKASHFPPVMVVEPPTGMVIGPEVSVTEVEPIKVVGVPDPLSS
jgi:hypothetical protein